MKTFLLGILFCASLAWGADQYVRKGASGNGSDWGSARGELSGATYQSGSTVWIAAGNYSTALPACNTANVSVKRATAASHGTATGWQNSYDGQVTVDQNSQFLRLNSGATNFLFDGQASYPWKFRVVGVRGQNGMIQVESASGFTFRGLEMDGLGEGTPNGGPEDGFRIGGAKDFVIEHCFIHNYKQAGEAHNDGVQAPSFTNGTFRYNIFSNNGMNLFCGDYEWSNQYANGISIYYNLFYNDGPGGSGSYNNIVFKGSNKGGAYWNYIDNNVFNLRGGGTIFYLANSPSPGCCNDQTNSFFRNNIVYSSPSGDAGFYSRSNNTYFNSGSANEPGGSTADPKFTNQAANQYTLQAGSPAIGSGVLLPYIKDFVGNNVSNPPSRGAFESAGAPPNPTPTPAPTATPAPSPPEFVIGGRIELTATETNIRSEPKIAANNLLGTQPKGEQGTLREGPTPSSDGIVWWNVNFDVGVDGWCGQDNFRATTDPKPTPTPAPTATPTPAPTATPTPAPTATPTPPATYEHKISDIEGLQEALDAKQDKR